MNRFIEITTTALLGFTLAACSGGHPSNAPQAASSTPGWAASVGDTISHALNQASTDLATRDITLTGRDDLGKSVPDAKITPTGDLVIDGKPVAVTPAQHAAVLAYREQLVAVAQQGIVIGGQGAKLGVTAAGDALAAIFSGKSRQELHTRLEARAAGIKEAAAKLCGTLPALRASQQRLAAEVPAFAPYASLTEEDVTKCRKDGVQLGGEHI